MNTEWVVMEPEEPECGPPKPYNCPNGWQSHTWKLAIEESRPTIWTDECRLCSDGLDEAEELWDVIEMAEIPVTISVLAGGAPPDSLYPYVWIEPT